MCPRLTFAAGPVGLLAASTAPAGLSSKWPRPDQGLQKFPGFLRYCSNVALHTGTASFPGQASASAPPAIPASAGRARVFCGREARGRLVLTIAASDRSCGKERLRHVTVPAYDSSPPGLLPHPHTISPALKFPSGQQCRWTLSKAMCCTRARVHLTLLHAVRAALQPRAPQELRSGSTPSGQHRRQRSTVHFFSPLCGDRQAAAVGGKHSGGG